MSQSQSNPWKVATFCIIASIAGALAAGVVVARVQDARHEVAQQTASASAEVENEPATEIAPIPEVEPTPQPVVAAEPKPQPVVAAEPRPVVAAAPKRSVEDCERYRYKTNTDGGRVVKNGLIGGALGAGEFFLIVGRLARGCG